MGNIKHNRENVPCFILNSVAASTIHINMDLIIVVVIIIIIIIICS